MKFSTANLFLIVLAVALVLGWRHDRNSLQQKYDRDIIDVSTVRSVQAYVAHGNIDERVELYDKIENHDIAQQRLLLMLTVFQLRQSFSNPTLANTFAKETMTKLGCKDIFELRDLVSSGSWDPRIVFENGTEDSTDFEIFIHNSMKPNQ